jgi:hypothetical protein
MTQMEMFEVHEKMPPPDEIVEHDGFTVRIYLPRYHSWMQAVDEAIMDLTGYSVYEFAEYPCPGRKSTSVRIRCFESGAEIQSRLRIQTEKGIRDLPVHPIPPPPPA